MTQSQYRRPSDDELLDLARSIAVVAHSGQTRRGNGEPSFNHLKRVAAGTHFRGGGVRAEIIAYLHDTIEDTTVTKTALLDLGFPVRVVHDVTMLTRSPDEKYTHYIGRLIEYGSDDALKVKLADLADNLSSLDTIVWDDETKGERLKDRYIEAEQWILAELNGREQERSVKLAPALTAA